MGGKKPEEYKGVAKFFTFLSDTDRQVEVHKASGYLPITKAAYAKTKASGLLQGVPVSRDAAAGAHQQGADRRTRAACGSATWCSCATSGPRSSRRRSSGKKTAKQALDDAVSRGNAMLRQFERTVSR